MRKPYFIFVIASLVFQPAYSQETGCRPVKVIEAEYSGPQRFSEGLLWAIGRGGRELGHLFGTIHVDDPAILELPGPVASALDGSERYVMEVIPSPEDAVNFSMAMFFMDGRSLGDYIPAGLFDKSVEILRPYGITREMVALMKPWAAYMIMSYPVGMEMVLDLHLLQRARNRGMETSALETAQEQISIFSDLDMEDQVQILSDTVCHYENIISDFGVIKQLYLERDLEGLYVYSQRYSFGDDSIYEGVSNELVERRNRRMLERMEDVLTDGNVFIAVGAMHLPGEEGLLNLLEQNEYTITRIY